MRHFAIGIIALSFLVSSHGQEIPLLTRKMHVDANYLQLPLMLRAKGNDPSVKKLILEIEGKVERFIHVDLAESHEKAGRMYSYDVSAFKGKDITLKFQSSDAQALEKLELSDHVIYETTYDSPHRPQIHFSPRTGWMNDVNGTYQKDGLYHLFYQANPSTAADSCGYDMHWGHSVSRDLVHWQEYPTALFPSENEQCWSGTTVMAEHDISGLTKKNQPVIFYTAMLENGKCQQSIATTINEGKTWQKFSGNPVLPTVTSMNRDPKVFWHAETKQYVMLLYLNDPDCYAFFTSTDLQNWHEQSRIEGWFECPEFFPLTKSNSKEKTWLLYGCYRTPSQSIEKGHAKVEFTSAYQLGKFDGKTFTPTSEVRSAHMGPNFYAAQTFANQENDRKIMMGWIRGGSYPNEPFNQCASLPLELSLKLLAGKELLCMQPAKEILSLRKSLVKNVSEIPYNHPAEICFTVDQYSKPIVISCRNMEFHFDSSSQKLSQLIEGKLVAEKILHPNYPMEVKIILDRSLVETYWNEGEAATSTCAIQDEKSSAIDLHMDTNHLNKLSLYLLKSIWNK